MKKKLYLFLACAAVAAMVLGGCGGKDKNNDAADGTEPDQKQDTLEYKSFIPARTDVPLWLTT